MVAVALTSLISLIAGITPFVIKGVLWAVGFKEELEKLSMTLSMIQGVLKHINEEQLDLEMVQTWARLLKDAVYDGEDLLGKLATALRQDLLGSCSYWQIRIHLNMKKLNRRFDHIMNNARLLPLVPTDQKSGPTPTSTSQVDMSSVVGRKDDTKEIVKMLLDDKINIPVVIRIVGMAGMGKTTLAQLVFNDPMIEQSFEESNRIWVHVTVNFDLSGILREIMMKSSTEINHTNLSHEQLCHAFRKFISGRRFFLVLDDVWTDNDEEWSRLLFLLQGGAKESRVLATSQKAGLCPTVSYTQIIHELKPLSHPDCWSLFQRAAFGIGPGNSCPPNLVESGDRIVRKCQNLPLAVQAMGAFLGRNPDPKKWQRISELDLWEAEQREARSERPNILPALKVSYNHLPFYLKPLFSYCSLFPRGYLFDKNQLIQLWIAEDLIQCQEHERAEEIAGQHFNELQARFFFRSSSLDDERFLMHDLFHQLAQSISHPYSCLLENNRQYNFTKRIHHVSLVREDVEQPLLDMTHKSKKVRTLLFPATDNFKVFSPRLNKRLGGMKYIRVLDLSWSTIQEVPNSIQKLKLLRYLNLSKTGIKRLPDFICKLYDLRTLLLLECASLSQLPKDFSKLINLRHLQLDQEFWRQITKLPPRIGTLTSLQNLHAFPIGREAGYGIDELKGMTYLTGTLHISNLENAVNTAGANLDKKENLNKLVLGWSSTSTTAADVVAQEQVLVKVLEGLQPHSELKELKIYHFRGSTFPHWMTSGQLRNLVAVSLKYHTRCKFLSLGQLPHLEKLKIQDMKELKELEESAGGSYASLTLLKINDCPNLTKLPSHFPQLEDVEICYCPKLEALPQKFMPKKVEICGCKLLKALPVPEYSQQLQHLLLQECEDGKLVGQIPKTSSLKSLVVSNMAKETSFPKLPQLPALEALHILGCNDLVSLSREPSVPFQSFFTSLKFLSIQGCSKLEALPNEGLPTTLECLTLGSCPNLHSFGPDDALKNLTSLKDLYINHCPKLPSLPEKGVPTSLQHLVIEGCPLLMERCTKENGGGPDWLKIMHIPDLEIDFLGVSSSLDLSKQIEDRPKRSSMRYFMQFKGGKIERKKLPKDLAEHRGKIERSKSAGPSNLRECGGTSTSKEQAEPAVYAEEDRHLQQNKDS